MPLGAILSRLCHFCSNLPHESIGSHCTRRGETMVDGDVCDDFEPCSQTALSELERLRNVEWELKELERDLASADEPPII